MKYRHILAAAAALAIGTPAGAQMVSAKDPNSLIRALQAKGFQAKLESAGGEPAIRSGAGGVQFTIFFENCNDGRACTTINFFTGFTDIDSTVTRMNEWNQTSRFTRAYIDKDGDPVLRMDVDLDHAGIPIVNFNEYLDIWASLAPKFLNFLRER